MANGQIEDRVLFLASMLLSSALPICRYILRTGNKVDREKLRSLTGTREYEELANILVQLRK